MRWSFFLMSLFATAFSMPIIIHTMNDTNYTEYINMVGGCIGTHFGCCKDNISFCMNMNCSSCMNATAVVS